MPTTDENRNTRRDEAMMDIIALSHEADEARESGDASAQEDLIGRIREIARGCNQARHKNEESYLTCGDCHVYERVAAVNRLLFSNELARRKAS